MTARAEWTLSEAARLLGERQHRLIYLCEKRVVVPDFGDANGRGSSRRFSARNLLEFSIALRLRKLTLSVGVIGAILYTLRGFEASLARSVPGFSLPFSLRADRPDLRVVVRDGEQLFFSLAAGGEAPRLFGGLDFQRLSSRASSGRRVDTPEVTSHVPAAAHGGSGLGGPEQSRYARLEISITETSRSLHLDA